MIKKIISAFILVLFCNSSFAQVKTIRNTRYIKKINDSTIVIQEKAIVPPKQIFNVRDFDTKFVQTFNPGQKVIFMISKETMDKINKIFKKEPPKQECFKVPCPENAPEGTTCWDCKPVSPQ